MRLADRSMPLGEDILLARHGDRILEMTQDRKNRLTVAKLADGSSDSAPNHLVDLDRMVAPSPVERLEKVAADYSEDRLPVSRRDMKFMLRLSAAWLAVSTVVVGATSWALYTYGDAETIISMMGSTF